MRYFLKDKGRRKERTVTTSNGLITIPVTLRAEKKKFQKRGMKTEWCQSKESKYKSEGILKAENILILHCKNK